MALSEVSRVLLSFGVDGVLENRVLLKTLHRQVHEDFRKEAPGGYMNDFTEKRHSDI